MRNITQDLSSNTSVKDLTGDLSYLLILYGDPGSEETAAPSLMAYEAEMSQMFERAAKDLGLSVGLVDCSTSPQLCEAYDPECVPAIVELDVNGAPVNMSYGNFTYEHAFAFMSGSVLC